MFSLHFFSILCSAEQQQQMSGASPSSCYADMDTAVYSRHQNIFSAILEKAGKGIKRDLLEPK